MKFRGFSRVSQQAVIYWHEYRISNPEWKDLEDAAAYLSGQQGDRPQRRYRSAGNSSEEPTRMATVEVSGTTVARIQIIFYSMYGHVYQMAEAVAAGAREAGAGEVSLWQVPELVPAEILERSGAAGAAR